MKTYLSFGGGVNSTAMYLMLKGQGVVFGKGRDVEALYIDHGSDWPETRKYVYSFAVRYPLTILTVDVQGHNDLYDHCYDHKMVPSTLRRWCTSKFKIRPINKYVEKPCFQMIGIDAGEAHRASISQDKGVENRYPLIENDVDREGCIEIIKAAGEEVPMKSGCFYCPFQRMAQWRKLRMEHPDLFCKAKKLEARNLEYREEQGKTPLTLIKGISLDKLEKRYHTNQRALPGLEELEFPPCNCGL